MIPVEPDESYGQLVVFAKNQPEYNDLPARAGIGGSITTRWHLSEQEIIALQLGADIYLEVITFNQPLQPIHIWVEGLPE